MYFQTKLWPAKKLKVWPQHSCAVTEHASRHLMLVLDSNPLIDISKVESWGAWRLFCFFPGECWAFFEVLFLFSGKSRNTSSSLIWKLEARHRKTRMFLRFWVECLPSAIAFWRFFFNFTWNNQMSGKWKLVCEKTCLSYCFHAKVGSRVKCFYGISLKFWNINLYLSDFSNNQSQTPKKLHFVPFAGGGWGLSEVFVLHLE